METQNETKAKELATRWKAKGLPYNAIYETAIEVMEWKDEQHAKERQALIQKYKDKLNKLNQREETIRDNVRRANSRYGFEGLF